jgi:putative ABC transport system permease protein
MSSVVSLLSVVATALRGLRSRLLLTVGSVFLATVAVAAAVVGPMYQAAAASSFVVSQLRSTPPALTGLSVDYTPGERVGIRQAETRAVAAVGRRLPHFGRPETSLVSRRMNAPGLRSARPMLLSQPGLCGRLVVTGTCPTRTGEALMLAFDAGHTHTVVGDTFHVRGVRTPFTLVGTYRVPAGGDGLFKPIRFRSLLPQPSRYGITPYAPGPFVVAPSTVTGMSAAGWFVRTDYRLSLPADTTLHDLHAATSEVAGLRAALRSHRLGDGLSLERGNVLRPVVEQAQVRRASALQTVTPAVVSLILVALVLLVRLLSAALELRRPELALAALRGVDRRQLWVLGMVEPVLILAIAAPIGVLAGYLAEVFLSSAWLVPGLPVRFGLASTGFAAGVLAVTLGAAAVVVRSATDEPLNVQIANVRRPVRSRRWTFLLRAALLAAAVAMLAASLWSGKPSKPNAADLLLPVVLAGAAGVLATLATGFAATWWTRRTAHRRGLAGFVASRTIARRREGTWLVLPMAVALAIAVFAAGIYSTAADWRASQAATMVGADLSFTVGFPLSRAVSITHQLDPEGRWLMAAGADADLDGPKVVVDAPRLARVARWPSSWTPGLSISEIGGRLSPLRPPLRLTGRRIQMTVDNRLGGSTPILVGVDLAAPFGEAHQIYVGPYPAGSTRRSASTAYCLRACEVKGLTISGPGALAQVMRGSVTISGIRVDGRPVGYFTRIGWQPRTARPFGGPPAPVTAVRSSADSLTLDIDSSGRTVVAGLAPRDLPAVPPVVMGRTATPKVLARHGTELQMATAVGGSAVVAPIATSESTPFFGPAGILVDDTTYTRDNAIFDAETTVYILARSDTPASILDALSARGITSPTTLDEVRSALDRDAYALALNLYLVVTAIVLLLAFGGLAVTMAVSIPARRRDAASLRVVGMPRRSIAAAVVLDTAAVLGAAALAGIAAGALAQYVVVHTLTLGYVDNIFTPRVLSSLDVRSVVELLGAACALMVCIAAVLGGLTVRGARSATLRENA